MQEQWLNTNKITSYESFLEGLDKHLLEFRHSAIAQKNNDYMLLYHISFPVIECYTFLKFSVRVHKSMNLDVWFQDIKLDLDDLKWLQLRNGCLEHWSQLENLLARLHNNEDTGKFSTVVSDRSLVQHASKIILYISTEANKDICTFLVEQLKHSIETPNQQRFSSSLIVSAYTLLIKSSAIYEHVSNNMLILPSSQHLHQLSSVMSESSESNSYLATKVNT